MRFFAVEKLLKFGLVVICRVTDVLGGPMLHHATMVQKRDMAVGICGEVA